METLLSMETASTVGHGVRSCRMASSEVLVPVLVGGPGSNVTFILDVSKNRETDLGSAKRLLIQTLLTKASLRDSLFNIIMSSGEVRSWSHHMLPCAPDVVYRALSWIRSVGCGPDRDLLTALTLAFSDAACHAVHLITTAPPPRPQFLLGTLPSLAAGRTLNVFYLQASGGPVRGTTEHLQSLSQSTGGCCYVVQDNLERDVEKVTPLCAVDSHLPVTCCCCSTSTSLLRCSLGNPLCPLTSCPEFFPGCRVLARRQMDSLYHLGTVVQEVQGCRGVWVIEFDHPGPGPVVVPSRQQMVCSLDMVAHTRAHARRPVPGDAVLSPWQPDPKRYGPGRVLPATWTENNSGGWTVRLAGSEGDRAAGIRVLMWDGSVSVVPVGLVWSISVPHHDRIVREIHCGFYTNRCYTSRCWSPLSSCYSCRSWSDSWSESRSRSWSRTEPRDTDVRRSDPELLSSSSSSSSSSCSTDDEATAPPPPIVKLRPRPPWRYWRRTGPEPQHRQPGGAATKTAPRPVTFRFPVPPLSASPNHSALFISLSATKGRRENVRDVLQCKAKPHSGTGTSVYG